MRTRQNGGHRKPLLIVGLIVTGIGAVLLLPIQPPYPSAQMMGRSMSRGNMQAMMAWMQGAEFDGQATGPRPQASARLLALGQRVYQDRCTPCHGARGDGQGPEAGSLSVPPTDFRRGVFKFRSTPSGTLPRPEDLFRTVSRGVHGTAMLPWLVLTEQERWAVVYYIQTFSDWFKQPGPGTPIPIPEPPSFTPALVEQGRVLFQELKCSDCHGLQGRGNGPRAAELTDDQGRPIRPRDFTAGRFKAGSTPQDIYRTVATGLDGTPMPAFELGPEYLWPVVAYVRSLIPGEPLLADRRRGGSGMMGMMGNRHPEERLGMMIDWMGMRGMMMRQNGRSSPCSARGEK